jgi:dihydroxyacetone kinase-like predicted kinase
MLDIFGAALANLQAHAEAINALNVFPVPDGDTGSNMLATLGAAIAEASALPDNERTVGAVAAAIGHGALMGARGNSGVILSQILRGFAEALAGRRRMNALDFAHALGVGSQTAHKAVVKPVEGTILTVVREAAQAAIAAAEHDPDLEVVLATAVEAAEVSVARTPTLLPILRDAGVVDAGGEGLYRVLQGALRGMIGRAAAAQPDVPTAPGAAVIAAGSEDGFGYETMFLVTAESSAPLDLDAIRANLDALGESVLVAGDARAAKVHVHNGRPDTVIAYALSLGTLSHVSIENLDRQAREAREARARALVGAADTTATGPGAGTANVSRTVSGAPGGFAGAPAMADERVVPDGGDWTITHPGSASPTAFHAGALAAGGHNPSHAGPAVVAVATGDGLASVFLSFGVTEVVTGGQSANPSTGELLRAAQRISGREILLLPNNPNVKLAAEQAAALDRDVRIVVVPTRNAAEGFAALMVFDPSRTAVENAGPMLAAARAMQTLAVTDAVRDARLGGRKVKRGQTIVLDPDDGLVAVNGDRMAAVVAGVEALRPGFELLTLYYGDGADLAEAEAMSTALRTALPAVEVELVHGGQPHYRYLIAAE